MAGVAVAAGLVAAAVGLTVLGSVGVSVLVTGAADLSGLGSVGVTGLVQESVGATASVEVAEVAAETEAAGLAVVAQREPNFQLHPH